MDPRPNETRLVLIRHGQAQASIDGTVAGHEGCKGLSELGRRQANWLRVRLEKSSELRADALYSSVLPRALETAEVLAPALGGLRIARDCDFCELHVGEADGMTWDDYRDAYGFDLMVEPERPIAPGGESLVGFQRRVDRRLRRLVAEHEGQTMVVVCHGGVISAASLALMGLAHGHDRPFRLEPANTSITEWARPQDPDRPWVLVRYADAAHVEAGY